MLTMHIIPDFSCCLISLVLDSMGITFFGKPFTRYRKSMLAEILSWILPKTRQANRTTSRLSEFQCFYFFSFFSAYTDFQVILVNLLIISRKKDLREVRAGKRYKDVFLFFQNKIKVGSVRPLLLHELQCSRGRRGLFRSGRNTTPFLNENCRWYSDNR